MHSEIEVLTELDFLSCLKNIASLWYKCFFDRKETETIVWIDDVTFAHTDLLINDHLTSLCGPINAVRMHLLSSLSALGKSL